MKRKHQCLCVCVRDMSHSVHKKSCAPDIESTKDWNKQEKTTSNELEMFNNHSLSSSFCDGGCASLCWISFNGEVAVEWIAAAIAERQPRIIEKNHLVEEKKGRKSEHGVNNRTKHILIISKCCFTLFLFTQYCWKPLKMYRVKWNSGAFTMHMLIWCWRLCLYVLFLVFFHSIFEYHLSVSVAAFIIVCNSCASNWNGLYFSWTWVVYSGDDLKFITRNLFPWWNGWNMWHGLVSQRTVRTKQEMNEQMS